MVQSLARPGGNTTGPATLTADLAPQRLEVLKEAAPKLREIAVLVNPIYPGWGEAVAHMETADRTLTVHIPSFEVKKPPDVASALSAIHRSHPDDLLIMPDPLTSSSMARIVEFAATNRLTAMYTQKRCPSATKATRRYASREQLAQIAGPSPPPPPGLGRYVRFERQNCSPASARRIGSPRSVLRVLRPSCTSSCTDLDHLRPKD